MVGGGLSWAAGCLGAVGGGCRGATGGVNLLGGLEGLEGTKFAGATGGLSWAAGCLGAVGGGCRGSEFSGGLQGGYTGRWEGGVVKVDQPTLQHLVTFLTQWHDEFPPTRGVMASLLCMGGSGSQSLLSLLCMGGSGLLSAITAMHGRVVIGVGMHKKMVAIEKQGLPWINLASKSSIG